MLVIVTALFLNLPLLKAANNSTELLLNGLTFKNSQPEDTIKQKKFCYLVFFDEPILNLNIQQGWRTMGEIAFGLADFQGKKNNYSLNVMQSIEMGSQFNFNPKHIIIGPELVYHVSFIFMCFGGSLVYITDFSKGTLYLNPHLGLSYNTFFELYAGYQIPLMKNHMKTYVNRINMTLAAPIIKRKYKL